MDFWWCLHWVSKASLPVHEILQIACEWHSYWPFDGQAEVGLKPMHVVTHWVADWHTSYRGRAHALNWQFHSSFFAQSSTFTCNIIILRWKVLALWYQKSIFYGNGQHSAGWWFFCTQTEDGLFWKVYINIYYHQSVLAKER